MPFSSAADRYTVPPALGAAHLGRCLRLLALHPGPLRAPRPAGGDAGETDRGTFGAAREALDADNQRSTTATNDFSTPTARAAAATGQAKPAAATTPRRN